MVQPLTPDKIAEQALPSVVLIRTADGLGTGFVVAEDGRIATSAHVIGDAQAATITLADGRKFDQVEVLGVDDDHDLMVLRIPARGLVRLPLGDSAQVKPGERVVAIGHPLGLGNTISDGIVSAVRHVSDTLTVLQITAPISTGSSGGPIFNDRGEVIGISALIVRAGQNLHFGMPVDPIKPMLANDDGIALASYRPPGSGRGRGRRRQIPNHELSLLRGSSDDQIGGIARAIEDAIKVGAPIYNQGNFEACYRIYAATAFDVDRKFPTCTGPGGALLDGVHRADGLEDWSDKAWAMRDAFDGVLDVIERHFAADPPAASARTSLPPVPPRGVPAHPLRLLDGCSIDNLQHIAGAIADAIEIGAPLYNAGNVEACYRVYEGAILEISRKVPGCAAAKQALHAGLEEASTRTRYADKAWALRDAFDGMLDVIERKLRDTN